MAIGYSYFTSLPCVLGNAKKGYRVLNIWNSSFNGPYVNSEYYIGWLDLWGSKHSHVSATAAAKTLDDSLRMRNSVNMYMFIGGTNFGFTSGKFKKLLTATILY